MVDCVSAMADEEERLRRYKRVLKFSQPVDRCYPKGRSTKRKFSHSYPDIEEHWLEVEANPWEGQGTGQYGSNPRLPMVRTYGAGRDSIVANYRLSDSYKSQFKDAVGLPLPTNTPQLPSQLQSPAPRSRSQSTYSSPPKFSATQSSSVINYNPSLVKNPVYSQPSATVVSGEGATIRTNVFLACPQGRTCYKRTS